MRKPVGFDPAGARKIIQVTRQAERVPKSAVVPSGPPRALAPTKYAIVTKQIGAAGTGKLGAGSVSLQAVAIDDSGAATYADLGITIPCYSGASSPIAVGRVVIIAVIDGFYHVIVDFC